MTKKSKTITSLVMTLAMLPACVPVIPAAAETLDSAELIIEDIDTYSKAEAIGSPVFVSDLYPTSGGIDTMTFMNNGSSGSYSGSGGKGRTFYINDTGYENPNYPDYSVGRAITYRPSAAEEYYVSRTGSSGSVYKCDAYVERYAGDTWGFNGFLYDATSSDSAYSSNGGYVVDGRVKDVSAAADDGYAVYTIEIAEGTSLDGAYLALAYIDMDDSWIRSSGYEHRGIIVAGVPLTDYYDAEAMGKQTVAVPLSAFDLTDERVFLGAATGSSRPDYSIFSDYENYRATNSVQLDGLRGMGIVRNDTDAETVTPFSYIAYNLAIADGYTAPTLTATYDEAADGIALSWTESGYTNTTYTITKSNGTETETIDAGEAVTYTDTDVTADTEYTYTVTSNVSMTSATTNATTYTIPSKSTAVTLTSESGGSTGSTVLDSESLIITEFDMSKGSSSTDAIGVPKPIFLSDYYVNSAGINPISFMNTYRSYSTTSNGRRFYINDTGYQDTDAAEYSLERSITYRPKVTGEYYVSRLSGDGVTVYKSDAYVAHYVGHLENGTTAPDSWIHDKWGFNGYGFANNIVANNYMDITDHVDTAYALYKICIPDDVSLDGVYLAITHTDEKYWAKSDGSHSGSLVVGVPITDYYDAQKRGWQTIKVPLSDFNFKGSKPGGKYFVSACYGSEYVLFNTYGDFLKYNNPQWEAFTGLGIVREDVDDENITGFNYEAANMAVVNEFTNAPELNAEFISSSNSVALTWTESGYTDTTYIITKNDGISTETIEVVDDTMYIDNDVEEGVYRYTVTASVGKYGMSATSDEVSCTVYATEEDDEIQGGTVVDKTVNVVKMDFNPMVYSNVVSPTGYYIGEGTIYNDYKTTWNYTKKGYQSYITDNNGDDTIDSTEQNPVVYGLSGSGSPDGVKNWGGSAWGYEGFRLSYSWNAADQSTVDAVPDEYWANVKNIADYKDTGYAVFEVELGDKNETTDGLYFALTCAKEDGAIYGFEGSPEIPFTKETHPNIGDWHYATSVIGVPLADYYNVEKGGCQVVAIPISDFINKAEFADMYSKSWGLNHYNNIKFIPELFSGMGVAKDDKDTTAVTTSEVYLKGLKVVNVAAPENFTVTDKKGTAKLSWDGTADIDTTYNVVKKYGGTTKYISTGTDNYYTDTDVVPGMTYTYSVVAVHTGTGANLKSAESNTVLYTCEGSGAPAEMVDAVVVDFEPSVYSDVLTHAAYYVGSNNGWNDYKTSWDWKNGGYYVKITDNNADDTIDDTEQNAEIVNLASHGSPSGIKNWGTSTWGYQGLRFGYNWSLSDQTTIDAVPDDVWGNVYDLSDAVDSAYAVFEINLGTENTATDGLYLAVASTLDTDYISGFDSAAGLPVTKENQPTVKSTQQGATAVIGVPLEDYYDFEKGGYQKMMVPLSEFINNPEFADVFGKSGFGLDDYNADDVKFNPALFEGMGILKDDTATGALEVTTLEAYLKNLQILNVKAPSYVISTLDGVDVALRWPISATNGVTAYEVYRNDELIATVPNTSYTDTEATGSLNSTYSVKAVHGDYGIKSNAVYSAALEIPVGAVKLYEGSGSSKTSTDYVTDGTMTVSGYSVESGNTFYAARYDSEGNLLGVGLKNLTAGEWGDVVFENVEEENVIKGFIWGSENMVSVIEPFVFKKLGIKTYSLTYPTYGKKAVTFNINDAAETDAALIELMHQYGINATFGLTGSEENYDMYVHDDFEIANHTTHIEMYLTEEYEDDNGNIITPPTYDECVASIEDAEAAITSGSGKVPSGLAWPYFAPEERSFYNQLKIYATTNGYEYIRDSQVTDTFDLPVDWKDWGITGWVQADNTDSILELADSLKALKPSSFKVMSIAGNGEDMTEEELLSFYESLFAKLSSGNIWKATNLEICRYVQACDELEITKEYIYNPTDVTVYMIVNDQQWVAEPGSYAHIVTEE